MRALLALLRREYIEHRGAFLIAPAVLFGIFAVGLGLAIATNRVRLPLVLDAPTVLKFYQLGFVGLSQGWWVYLLVTLFFYYADAFSADRRNNAMLFWKSMPVSDLGMLMSKMLAGLLLFSAVVLVFAEATGLLLYAFTALSQLILPNLTLPAPERVADSYLAIAWFNLCQFALGVLWYAPFFAWVGALSTVFGRWSIPLSIAIPAVVALLENAAFYGSVPNGGYLWAFLSERAQFGLDYTIWTGAAVFPGPVDPWLFSNQLIATIDWLSLAGGIVVAAVLVFLASLYRRRGV